MAIEARSEPDLKLELVSQARYLSAARTMVGAVASRLGFDDIHSGQISLAVDEALCNIIKHGYCGDNAGRIWLSLWAIDNGEGNGGLRVVIEDRARQVEVSEIRSRNLDEVRPGGLGVFIIREVMDEVVYEKREGGGMRLTLVKRLPDCREPARVCSGATTGPEEKR